MLSLTQNNPIIHQIEGHLWMISLLTIVYGEVMAVVKICPSDLHQILAKKTDASMQQWPRSPGVKTFYETKLLGSGNLPNHILNQKLCAVTL